MLPAESGTSASPQQVLMEANVLSTRIKDTGIAIRHSCVHTFSILQGPETGWKGSRPWAGTQNERERHVFVTSIEKYIEDTNQVEKHIPDLLEAIMRPTRLVKEELRPTLFKMCRFRPEITKIRV